jgi:hypothetical protein
MESVYPQEVGYQQGTNLGGVRLDRPLPQRLPDALFGQQWTFVTLDAGDLLDMPDWEIGFGEAFPLDIADLSGSTPVPGILIFSPRALPLAGWLSGLELAYLRFDHEGKRLVLETGTTESWVLANIKTPQLLTESENFAKAKQAANGVHFIGVQSDPQAQSFTGFWLLQEVELP